MSGLPRIDIELHAVVEAPDKHFVGVQRNSQPEWRRIRPDDAMDGEGRVSRVTGGILYDLETERRLHGRRAELDDAPAEGARLRGDLFEHSRAFVFGDGVRVEELALEQRDARALPLHRRRGTRTV